MGNVIIGLSTSVDGIASGTTEQDFQAVHEAVLGWVFNLRSWQAAQGMDGGQDSPESQLWASEFAQIGAQIVGRRIFDFGYPYWGDDPPFHAPVFVVTHRPGERIDKDGGTSYTFITDGLGAAIDRARDAAGGKDVLIAGGLSIAQQALAEGLAGCSDVRWHAVRDLNVKLTLRSDICRNASTAATRRYDLGSPPDPICHRNAFTSSSMADCERHLALGRTHDIRVRCLAGACLQGNSVTV
jgi:dihydrofolate reductase